MKSEKCTEAALQVLIGAARSTAESLDEVLEALPDQSETEEMQQLARTLSHLQGVTRVAQAAISDQ